MSKKSDGAIVGSAIVRIIAEHGKDAAPFLYDYVKTLAKNKIADATAIKFASTIFSDLGDMLQELAGRLEEGDVAEEPRHCAEVTDAETNEMIDDILAGM